MEPLCLRVLPSASLSDLPSASLSDVPSASLLDLCVSASSLVDLVSASSVLVVCLLSVSLGCSSPSWCAASSSLWDLSEVGLSASVLTVVVAVAQGGGRA